MHSRTHPQRHSLELRSGSHGALSRRMGSAVSDLSAHGTPAHKHDSGYVLINEPSKEVREKKRQTRFSTEPRRLSTGFEATQKACKRVIAPYVNIVRKGQKAGVKSREADHNFMFYLKRKPSVLSRSLREFLDDSVDLKTILHETSDTLKNVTHANSVRVYIVDETSGEIYLSNRQPNAYTRRICWKIEEGKTIAAHVAARLEPIWVKEILADDRFPEGIPYTDASIKSVICVPVMTSVGNCYAILELARTSMQHNFKKHEYKMVLAVASWIGTAICTNLHRIMLNCERKLNNYLMEYSKCYFADNHLFENLIIELVRFIKSSVNAQRTTFYIIDHQKDDGLSYVFDESPERVDDTTKRNLRLNFMRDTSIARHVAQTGLSINLKDAFNDPRFAPELSERSGLIARSVLCMPVTGKKGILGVVEAVNKIDGKGFSTQDEVIMRNFCTFCDLTLQYSNMNRSSMRLTARYEVSLGVIKRHLLPCRHEMAYIKRYPKMYENVQTLQTFQWYISLEYLDHMRQIAIFMIMDIGGHAMDKEEVIKFVLTVRNYYRDVGYHNWEHGFNVCHCMYNLLIRNKHRFTHTEMKGLMIATLAHDIDHGGVTNNFLVTASDVMYLLYEDSPWEVHHYTVLMMVLSEIHVFKNVSEEEFKVLSEVMRHAILSTDLAYYFRIRQKLGPVVYDETFDWEIHEHKYMAVSVMMTMCDLSGQCKPFQVTKRLTENLYVEFYAQGDIEKSMGLQPISLMNREKVFYQPEDQVTFLTVLVLPCADLIRKLLVDCETLHIYATMLTDDWRRLLKLGICGVGGKTILLYQISIKMGNVNKENFRKKNCFISLTWDFPNFTIIENINDKNSVPIEIKEDGNVETQNSTKNKEINSEENKIRTKRKTQVPKHLDEYELYEAYCILTEKENDPKI
ncbi:cyclic nucleotide phosphodiesterase [Holotrichia oblita]|uniref:Cyclic nucleotide phosphodiesterase n=1 Tax=Holotrichia oblita TaxID=644536 RepID=A0ACB9SMR5_HOLOL|nr:cyclic nucleotide phosphodiesterase [Holotrichia oblita]